MTVVKYAAIDGFPGYRVGNDGTVWTCREKRRRHYVVGSSWRQLKPKRKKKGYLYVCLYVNGRAFYRHVHRLVLVAFKGKCPPGMESRHLDGDPSNNDASNLEWATPTTNNRDKQVHGTQAYGERHHNAILTTQQVSEIRTRYAAGGISQSLLGKEFGVSQGTVRDIVNNKHRTRG